MLSEKNEIARSIRKIGHEIKGVVCYTGEKVDLDGFTDITYFKIRKPKWLFIALYHLRMLTSVFSDNFNVILFGVHSSHLIPFIKLISYLKSQLTVLVYDIRSVPVDLNDNLRSKLEVWRYNFSISIADNFCDGITCITPMLGSTLQPKLKKLQHKIGHFQTGVNFKIFNPQKSSIIRDSLGLSKRFVVIYHGVLSPNRGIQNTIKAIAICKQHIPSIMFMIVGSGAGERELINLTEVLKLQKNVLFTGAVPFENVPNYIISANVGIIPLPAIDWWNVSSPIKLKEYLSMQLPVIATDIPAHRFVIKKTGGASLIRNCDPQTISNAIKAYYKSRKLHFPMKSRKELHDIISFHSQAHRFIEHVSNLKN